MLALSVMKVVFVLKEKITLGRWEHLTAGDNLNRKTWLNPIKCHSDVVYVKA